MNCVAAGCGEMAAKQRERVRDRERGGGVNVKQKKLSGLVMTEV